MQWNRVTDLFKIISLIYMYYSSNVIRGTQYTHSTLYNNLVQSRVIEKLNNFSKQSDVVISTQDENA